MRTFIITICISLLTINTALAITPLTTTNHFINIKPVIPALREKNIQLYLREIKSADKNTHYSNAVLFIHGGGTPSEVAFDVPYKDYSWMAYLANEGFAVYALDLTGYGRSTRPSAMNNPCNLSAQEQQQFIPSLIKKSCAAIYDQAVTTNESDWADMDAVVDFIRHRLNIRSIALIGWSQGGPRSFGYSLRHPEKVNNFIFLAPAYGRDWPLTEPPVTALTELMGTQNKAEFNSSWDTQLGCANQVEEPIRNIIWQEMLASDTLGTTWGTGVRRAPNQIWRWGFNRTLAAKINTPTLLITGEFDRQVSPKTVRELYTDLGSQKKVFIDLACSSHRANWEKNHLLLFKASADWLKNNSVSGTSNGELKIGYSPAHNRNSSSK